MNKRQMKYRPDAARKWASIKKQKRRKPKRGADKFSTKRRQAHERMGHDFAAALKGFNRDEDFPTDEQFLRT